MEENELLENNGLVLPKLNLKRKTIKRSLIYLTLGIINIIFYEFFIKEYRDIFMDNISSVAVIILGPLIYSLVISLIVSLVPFKKRKFKIKYILIFVIVAMALQAWLSVTFTYVYIFQILTLK